ncbi:DUF924 family protein [Pseudorhodoferax sp. Leaf265]|uniref:DUF924 family protein n=1 Tax=Pseudorhodoferax sp. Leaf265 TaxID=1736315 RepID=UPI0006F3DF48|nr:DUF924 family protein [Pseudorhodoferax sp. Leaf265]KQP14551.1 hypothetical protein ASF45_30390 [Pseudorhodoferax sp. Leaf265]
MPRKRSPPEQEPVPPAQAAAVVQFWRDAGPARWFAKDAAFDRAFRERFHDLHFAAAARRCDAWVATAEGALALLLLLDQYPRNSFRGTGHMYATDPLARMFCRQALDAGLDRQVPQDLRLFFYLPLSHSEDMPDQQRALALNRALGEPFASHAQGHLDIVARFGRFPHRNAMLGRETTAAEQAFLAEGGFAG